MRTLAAQMAAMQQASAQNQRAQMLRGMNAGLATSGPGHSERYAQRGP